MACLEARGGSWGDWAETAGAVSGAAAADLAGAPSESFSVKGCMPAPAWSPSATSMSSIAQAEGLSFYLVAISATPLSTASKSLLFSTSFSRDRLNGGVHTIWYSSRKVWLG